ncbi:MAG: TetR/AcrR family transcriptional regulator [Thermomicrobiales bacterium]
MPARAGLDSAAVVRAAADLADANGIDVPTLGDLAAHLGIRTPSLYNHIAGLDGLRRDLALLGVRELNVRLSRAAIGKAGDAAIKAFADAYRAFAHAHPGLYAATQRAPEPDDSELHAAADEVVATIVAVLAAYGLEGDDAVHTVRVLRSFLHGFVSLEMGGGFGLPLNLDESFRRLLHIFIAGLHQQETRQPTN